MAKFFYFKFQKTFSILVRAKRSTCFGIDGMREISTFLTVNKFLKIGICKKFCKDFGFNLLLLFVITKDF